MNKILIILIVVTALVLIAGCEESAKTPIWGTGETNTEWQDYFGNDNIARLDFVQTRAINEQGQAIAVLAERVRKLEVVDPNEVE